LVLMPRRRKRPFLSDLSLDPETLHGVLTVVVFAIAAILLLSTFNLAGSFGIAIDKALASVFGWDRVILPFMLLAIGIREASPNRLSLSVGNYVGFLLFYFSLNPLVHAARGLNVSSTAEELAQAGGRMGALVADPFVGIFGGVGAIVVFAALFLVSLLLTFNTSLKRVVQVLTMILHALMRVGQILIAPFKWMLKKRSLMAEERVRSAHAVPPPVVEEEEEEDEEEGEEEDEESEEGDEEEGDVVSRPLPPPKPKKRVPMVQIPVELLTKRDQKPTSGDIQHNQFIIQRTLETFGIPVEMGEYAVGPTVTQFTLKPSEGVKLSRITALHNDLALALAAHPIRIEAPIPGKALVGIEVPNQSVATVGLREMFESKEWKDHREGLAFALGRDVSGKASLSDIGRMPHMLVAGATGSGKSVCLNTIIMSLLYANGPDDLKFIMVDPKRVELQVYNGIPHLVTPVITDTEKTVNALKWALREMDRRFDVLSKFGARDIGTYNTRSQEKLPYLVVIIDELADLMVTASADVEGPVVRLAQMARAVGIHLVLATQRPSTDVITGLIKANIPARFAFAVASSIDSRTILDATGAEKLLGRGDMLMQTSDMSSPRRVQGAFVSDDEISRVVGFLKSKYEPAEYDSSVVERPSSGGSGFSNAMVEDSDPLIPEAKEEIIRAGKASASLLQRRLKVGYARAARLLDLLEQEGFIGPGDGAKPREILKVEFTKGMDQAAVAPTKSDILDQVNAELPPMEGDEDYEEEDKV
jgi:S-DNA-T family DNA segregation ATPase FtsK/SpoIIIE